MPRQPRIEYEHAFYHVINWGRARCMIFHEDFYYQTFLDTLGEACLRFDCLVHAYCLMGNHYHILIETPKANLSRIMRHINGVYTQRYNCLKNLMGHCLEADSRQFWLTMTVIFCNCPDIYIATRLI